MIPPVESLVKYDNPVLVSTKALAWVGHGGQRGSGCGNCLMQRCNVVDAVMQRSACSDATQRMQ